MGSKLMVGGRCPLVGVIDDDAVLGSDANVVLDCGRHEGGSEQASNERPAPVDS